MAKLSTSKNMASMKPELWQFVDKHRVFDDNYQYTSQLQGYEGKFRIEAKDEEEFWTKYSDWVVSPDKFYSGLAQRPGKMFAPMRVDIDLRKKTTFNIPEGKTVERLYTQEDIGKVIRSFHIAVNSIAKIKRPQQLICFVLEKPRARYEDGLIKDGFHLHWPALWINHSVYNVQILPRVQLQLDQGFPGLFASCGVACPSEVIDKQLTSKCWLMFGSLKGPKSLAYKLSSIAYDADGKEISPSALLKSPDWNLLDSNQEVIPLHEEKWEYYLPRILSIDQSFLSSRNTAIRPLELKPDSVSPMKQLIPEMSVIASRTSNPRLPTSIEDAKELCKMINNSRISTYDSWFRLGCIIKNISHGAQQGLELFVEVSSRTTRDNYDSNACIDLWNHLDVRDGPSMPALYGMAKEDNPDMYNIWKKKKSTTDYGHPRRWSHSDLAIKIHNEVGEKFWFATAEKGGEWYKFTGHRWELDKNGFEMCEYITGTFPNILREGFKPAFENVDEETRNREHTDLLKVIMNLGMDPYVQAVLRQCRVKFRSPDFNDKKDSDPCLIGFENGVFDCRQMKFRAGRRDDYVTKSVGYEFKEFTRSDPQVMETIAILKRIFPDEDLFEFWMDYAACLLRGGNYRKTLLNLNGFGDNGKSILIEFMEHVLRRGVDGYMIKLPTSLIVGKRALSSAATPETYRSHGARFAVLQEPAGGDKLNFGTVKELTGNDSFFSRGLWNSGKEITPMFKTALASNQLPEIPPETDRAGFGRLEVLPFESYFPKKDSEVPATREEQEAKKIFPRDHNLNEKLGDLKQAKMWLMVERYKKIKGRMKTTNPKKVDAAMEQYQRNNDVFLEFISERLKQDESKESKLSLSELWTLFMEWYKFAHPHTKMPERKLLDNYLSTKWGRPDKMNKWVGWRIRSQKDDLEEGKAIYADEDDSEENKEDE